MSLVYLGLGSNEGNRIEHLRAALRQLAPHVNIIRTSTVFESKPMYVTQQPHFLNMAVEGETSLMPAEMLAAAKAIEQALGRPAESHNRPRPIDIDILLYDDAVLDTPELALPHPRMHERLFVIVPLAEIAPLVEHPTLNKPIADIEESLGYWGDNIWVADEQL